MLELKLVRPNAIIPTAAHAHDAGVDLCACLDEPVEIYPGQQVAVPTGLAISLPPLVAGLILPRSGLARNSFLTVGNSPGLVDCGYSGEIIVLLRSFARSGQTRPYIINHGDRIAQLVLTPIVRYPFAVVDSFTVVSERGENGFGSTGIAKMG
jgi:dUTP pyrophosphatase